jgi:toxin YoeB
MEIKYTPQAQDDIKFWKKSGNKPIQKKITSLIEDILKHPYTGIGKPEALKYELLDSWSRRISLEDRLVYVMLTDEILEIQSAKGHY